jgi:lactoylglutathione lyase
MKEETKMLADARCVYLFVYVSDLARSRAFYADTLGLRVIEEDADCVKFDGGQVILALNRASDHGIALPEKYDHSADVVFLVDDLRAVQAALERRGVEFLPTSWYEPGGIADFYDPDGHWLTLYEPSEAAMAWPSGEKIRAVTRARSLRSGSRVPVAAGPSPARPDGDPVLDGSELFYVFLFVPDPEAAKRFYSGRLGLTDIEGGPCSQLSGGDQDGVIKYDTGGILVTTHFIEPTRSDAELSEHLCPPKELDRACMKGVAPALLVDDVEGVVAALAREDEGFQARLSRSGIGVVASCEDPGGHLLFLYQPSPEALRTPSGRKIQEILATPL